MKSRGAWVAPYSKPTSSLGHIRAFPPLLPYYNPFSTVAREIFFKHSSNHVTSLFRTHCT